MSRKTSKKTDAQLNRLYEVVASGLDTIYEQYVAEEGKGRASILFCALAGYLAEREITASLLGMAIWMGEQCEHAAKKKVAHA